MTPPTTADRLFDAFPPVSDEEWLAAIEKDLKGKRFEDVLVWEPLEGFPVQPFYRTAPASEGPTLSPPPAGWTIRQDILDPDPQAAVQRAEHALEQGAEALGFVVRLASDTGPGTAFPDADAFDAWMRSLVETGASLHLEALDEPERILDRWLAALDAVEPSSGGYGSLMMAPIARAARQGRLASASVFDSLARTLEAAAGAQSIRALGLDLEPYHEAGASATQELACLLAAAQTYLSELTDRGLSPTALAHQLHVRVPAGTSYFMEIAKLRALRRLLGQVLAAYDSDAGDVPVLVQAATSRRSMTLYDPYVNMLRATTQAASAILGGCDTLTVRPYNAVFGTPDDFGLRIARTTQLILRDEAYLHKVVDPSAGSYYIEHLTDDLGEQAWTLFQEIESQGGLLAVLKTGWLQGQITETRQARAQQLASRRRVLVGTNQYPNTEETLSDNVTEELAAPTATVDGTAIEPLPPVREAAAFETLRRRTEAYADAQDHVPTVYLLPFGHRALRSARANFARNFFGCAGFAIEEGADFDEVEAAADALRAVQADVVVLCSADDAYRPAAPPLIEAIQQTTPDALVVVAGNPTDDLDALRDAGVNDFIHLRRNVLETLLDYQRRLGILDAAT